MIDCAHLEERFQSEGFELMQDLVDTFFNKYNRIIISNEDLIELGITDKRAQYLLRQQLQLYAPTPRIAQADVGHNQTLDTSVSTTAFLAAIGCRYLGNHFRSEGFQLVQDLFDVFLEESGIIISNEDLIELGVTSESTQLLFQQQLQLYAPAAPVAPAFVGSRVNSDSLSIDALLFRPAKICVLKRLALRKPMRLSILRPPMLVVPLKNMQATPRLSNLTSNLRVSYSKRKTIGPWQNNCGTSKLQLHSLDANGRSSHDST